MQWADKKRRSGFTIVELLIVIVVIAILAAVTIVAYNGITSRTKDARRLSDLASIQKGLELYFADNNSYPDVTAGVGAGLKACIGAADDNGAWKCWNEDADNQRIVPKQYMKTIPKDPQIIDSNAGGYPNKYQSRMYCYRVKADLQGYMLGAYIETLSPSDSRYFNGGENVGYCNFANYLIRKNY